MIRRSINLSSFRRWSGIVGVNNGESGAMTARYFRSSLSSSSPLTHSVLARSSVFWGDEILNDGGKWKGMMMMMVAAAALVVTGNGRKNTTECCGIAGVLAPRITTPGASMFRNNFQDIFMFMLSLHMSVVFFTHTILF